MNKTYSSLHFAPNPLLTSDLYFLNLLWCLYITTGVVEMLRFEHVAEEQTLQ